MTDFPTIEQLYQTSKAARIFKDHDVDITDMIARVKGECLRAAEDGETKTELSLETLGWTSSKECWQSPEYEALILFLGVHGISSYHVTDDKLIIYWG